MTLHQCCKSTVCRCYLLALEPNEQCPVHGWPYPPRCGDCGRFLPAGRAARKLREQEAG